VPELLAPAGTPEKLKTALHFGADAVYLGLRRFSLRSFAGNFDLDELEWAIGYAHDRGRRVYVCVNLQPFDDDLPEIERALERLAWLKPDALIVADPGVAALARRVAPGLELHLSTQASVTNAAAARFWAEQGGVRRIIVARELSLERLRALARDAAPVELEAFVHGAVCIAWSGRCLLSLYWADRDPRRGACAQGCRWGYRELEDRRRPGEANRVEQDERGTYFFDAKDLCGLPVLDRLVATGVRSLKIEGRTRSAHYVAVVADVYRHALDRIASGDAAAALADVPRYLDELSRPGGRGFSTHFLTGEQDRLDAYLPAGHSTDGKFDFVGEVVAVQAGVAVLEVRNPVDPGAVVEVRFPGLRQEAVRLDRLRGEDGAELDRARTGTRLLLPPGIAAEVGAIVRRARVAGETRTAAEGES
jgi:putative protease